MKLALPKIKKFRFTLIINLLLAFVIFAEVFFVYYFLYRNLNPQPAEVKDSKVVKVDLKAYREISQLLDNLANYTPAPIDYKNSNPFKYQ
jgi:hypothetical protein